MLIMSSLPLMSSFQTATSGSMAAVLTRGPSRTPLPTPGWFSSAPAYRGFDPNTWCALFYHHHSIMRMKTVRDYLAKNSPDCLWLPLFDALAAHYESFHALAKALDTIGASAKEQSYVSQELAGHNNYCGYSLQAVIDWIDDLYAYCVPQPPDGT